MDSARTPADITGLLMELNRTVRGQQFYPDGHPQLKEMLERSLRSWQNDLESHGALDLEIRKGSFRLLDSKLAIGKGTLDELAREFGLRSIRRFRAEREYPEESFRSLLEILAMDPERLREQGGVGQWLVAQRAHGLQVNEINLKKHLEDAFSLADGAANDLADLVGEEGAPQALKALFAQASPAEAEQEESLSELLTFLEAPQGDDAYSHLLARISGCVQDTCNPEHLCKKRFEALWILAQHVGEASKRSASQRQLAQESLIGICPENILRDLVKRSFSDEIVHNIPTREILLALREHGAKTLLDEIENEFNPDRREKLQQFFTELRDSAIPAITHSLRHGTPPRARIAVRMAGRMRIESIVPLAVTLLGSHRNEVYKEAIYALVRIGGDEAFDALCTAAESNRTEIARLAIFGLGTWGGENALTCLFSFLQNALPHAPTERVQEILRAIGRLELPAAVPTLDALLKKRSFFHRRRLVEIQGAAVNALARIPGEEAQCTLLTTSQHRSRDIRESAQEILHQRTKTGGA